MDQELQVQRKREVESKQESTIPARAFVPVTDIFETDQALTLKLEMPGVAKDRVEVRVENDVLTIEGLAADDKLHPIQQAFVEHSGYQCGFCTSGQIMSTKVFLDRTPDPTEDQARLALSGNLCRCAAYKRILESVMAASRLLRA